jgi:hypothetical protein
VTTADEADVFMQLRQISHLTRNREQESAGREMLVRFLDSYNGNTPELPLVDSLCARFGLYPYMSANGALRTGEWEALAVEFHTPAPLAQDGFTFHAEQQRIYQRLMDGESIILSAPTSFGKSAIIDALVASEKWTNIALIVPTIALIDETRRRLVRFRSLYQIVTHPDGDFGDRNIIAMTQERFLEIPEIPPIDFFMIDEFYKLSGPAGDARSTLLNLAWNQLRATGAQYYLIGPNIDGLDDRVSDELHERLIVSEFKTVAVDVEDRSEVEDQLADLLHLLSEEIDSSTLVFTGSPKKADDLARDIASVLPPTAGFANEVADWIAENYDVGWNLVDTLRSGVAIHSGPLPRGIQRLMVRLFNSANIPILVCTTTLIEGVNTAAKTVVIFEKKIDNQLIDFFTFSNIRGRAGRMFRHYVGRVVTYMPPPEIDETTVDIPIDSQSEKASDAALVQLDFGALDKTAQKRLQPIYDQTTLSLGVIRKNRGLDPTLQIFAARQLMEMDAEEARLFSWSGSPSPAQSRAVLEFAFHNLLIPVQRRGINFNMLWGQLQNMRVNAENFSAIVDQQVQYARKGVTRSDVITGVFGFQRNWMGFTIPSMLRGLQSIQAEILPQLGIRPGNYEYLLREIEGLYLPQGVAELDEYGLPLPLGLKLHNLGLQGDTQTARIASLMSLMENPTVVSHMNTVEQWIVADVLEGLLGGQP